jgi:hypothetical protein
MSGGTARNHNSPSQNSQHMAVVWNKCLMNTILQHYHYNLLDWGLLASWKTISFSSSKILQHTAAKKNKLLCWVGIYKIEKETIQQLSIAFGPYDSQSVSQNIKLEFWSYCSYLISSIEHMNWYGMRQWMMIRVFEQNRQHFHTWRLGFPSTVLQSPF